MGPARPLQQSLTATTLPRALASVVLPTGETTFAFDVTINGDTTVEPTETFSVVLSAVTGATLADGTALGTIVNDDDPPPVVSDVVISQVYGGGGNSGAPLKNDYIELFNRGSSAISLNGWSVQYNAANQTTAWQVTPLTGTIPPNTYYLIQEAAGTGVAAPLPTPDASGTIALGSTAGKVALVATTTPITGACPANAIDIVGYGATNCFEGTGPAPTLSNTTAALRVHGGCADANDNSADFVSGNPSPRNSLLGARSCIPVDAAIHDIQGDGAMSTFVGQEVQTSGIVTGAKSNGFFLQAPDALADNNPATSEGIFVFTRRPPAVAIGNVATVRSTVSEFFGLTQLESPLIADLTVTAASAELPAPVELTTAILDPAGTPEQMERFEGMRLYAASLTSVAPTNEFGEIATVLTGSSTAVPRARDFSARSCSAGSDDRRHRLLHPALRREPRANRDRQRRPRGSAGPARDVERRDRQRHRAPRLRVWRLQDSAAGATGCRRQHEWRCRARSARRRVHRRWLQYRELHRQRCQEEEGGAGDPSADAVAGRHRPHRDTRSSHAPGTGGPGQCRCRCCERARSRLSGGADSHADRRGDAECRLSREDVPRADRCGDAGACRRHLHRSDDRPSRDCCTIVRRSSFGRR